MKAIILAAGKGTRLNKYTQNLPKGMLKIHGKTIIQHQVDIYNENGITDITIVKGYCGERINIPYTKTYSNNLYANTNMVESLFCASNELTGDVIISYADVIFEDRLLKKAINFDKNIGVLVDNDWKKYWKIRYGKVDFDTESLKLSNDGSIASLGISNPPLDEIDGRYIGVIRLNNQGCKTFFETYFEAKKKFSGNPWINGRLFEKIYMTDFLQEIINQNNKIYPILVKQGWLEFDTNEDFEIITNLLENNNLSVFSF